MKVKVAVAGTVGKVVVIDTNPGAQIGTSLRGPAGNVLSVDELRALLAGSGSTATRHSALQGLQQGNDHPQYPLKLGRETIKGQWDFTLQVWAANGTAVAPSYSFTNDVNTGWYWVGADNFGAATAGVLRWDVSTTLITSTLPLRGPVGTVSSLTYGFTAHPTTGMHWWGGEAGDEIGFSTNGVHRVDIGALGLDVEPSVRTAGGSAVTPSHTFWESNDVDTGMYRANEDQIGFTCGGTLRLSVVSSGARAVNGTAALPAYAFLNQVDAGMYLNPGFSISWAWAGANVASIRTAEFATTPPMRGPFGSAAEPTFSFWDTGGTNNGMYLISSGNLGFTTSGVLRITVSTAAVTSTLPILGADGSGTAPGYSFSGDTNTGMFRAGADDLRITAGGGTSTGIQVTATTFRPFGVVILPDAGSAAAPMYSYSTDPDTGVYNHGADSLGFSVGGVLQGYINASSFILETTATNKNFMAFLANGQAANNRAWAFRIGGAADFNLSAADDSGAATSTAMTFLRSGLTVTEVRYPTIGTTASAANAFLNASNSLLKSTSSMRYKEEVEDVSVDFSAQIRRLRPVTYKSKARLDGGRRFIGLIAEEVAQVTPMLVHFDEQGEPDGVQYDRVTVLLLTYVQSLEARIAQLESKSIL